MSVAWPGSGFEHAVPTRTTRAQTVPASACRVRGYTHICLTRLLHCRCGPAAPQWASSAPQACPTCCQQRPAASCQATRVQQRQQQQPRLQAAPPAAEGGNVSGRVRGSAARGGSGRSSRRSGQSGDVLISGVTMTRVTSSWRVMLSQLTSQRMGGCWAAAVMKGRGSSRTCGSGAVTSTGAWRRLTAGQVSIASLHQVKCCCLQTPLADWSACKDSMA